MDELVFEVKVTPSGVFWYDGSVVQGEYLTLAACLGAIAPAVVYQFGGELARLKINIDRDYPLRKALGAWLVVHQHVNFIVEDHPVTLKLERMYGRVD